ncbi:MAG TPA: HAD hydrolase-like protein [Candidatus Saccharimonadales bacterium]|nr:HAD hydrolase-like protein [Candidatus Saccharimonadales bacterium]
MKTVIFTLEGALLRVGDEQTTLHKGVDELLPILRRLGVRLVAFGPGSEEALSHLERLGAHGHFHHIATDNKLATSPRSDGLQILVNELQALPHEVMIVGDRVADIILGKNAGIQKVIGVSHGQSTPEALRAAGADHVVHDIPAVLDVLG